MIIFSRRCLAAMTAGRHSLASRANPKIRAYANALEANEYSHKHNKNSHKFIPLISLPPLFSFPHPSPTDCFCAGTLVLVILSSLPLTVRSLWSMIVLRVQRVLRLRFL